MEEQRLLLPFTYGVNTQAILSALRLAHSLDATMIPVSLIPLKQAELRSGRIEQSQDFLETVRYQAEHLHVSIKCHEVRTHNVQQSIKTMTQEWCCTGVVVVVKEQQGLLLERQELRELLEQPPASLVLLRLPTHSQGSFSTFLHRMTAWMSKSQDSRLQPDDTNDYLDRVVASLPYSINGQVRV